ncbi:MAG: YbaN family protein [Actinomycetota bacterium]
MADTVGTHKPVAKARSPLVRGIYFVLGLICLGFAYLSFLPGIPTFDFVILAAFFFARSSDTFHNWLVNHRVFGRIIAAYRGGGLTRRTKLVAAVGIVASLTFSGVVLMDNTVLRVILVLVGAYALWFVFSRPTRELSPRT